MCRLRIRLRKTELCCLRVIKRRELDSRSGMRLSGGLFWLGERGAILRFIFPSWHVCRRKSSQDSGAWKMRLQCADVRDPVDGTTSPLTTSHSRKPECLRYDITDGRHDFSGESLPGSSHSGMRSKSVSQTSQRNAKTLAEPAKTLQRSFVRNQASQTRP